MKTSAGSYYENVSSEQQHRQLSVLAEEVEEEDFDDEEMDEEEFEDEEDFDYSDGMHL